VDRVSRASVIVNPVAGPDGHRPGAGSARADRARRALRAHGVIGEVVITPGRGHAAALVRDLVDRGAEVVIAWGGDGTINEVAGALIGTATPLGIVRSGSGDGLARSLRVSEDPDQAIASAVTGSSHLIDVGYLGDRHFLNVGGIGFDAAVATAFNRGGRRGQLRYLLRTLQAVWTYRASRYRLQLEHEASDSTRFLVAFANGSEYGGHLVLSADADLSDGWLDAVIVDDGPAIRQVWRMRRLALGVRRPAEGIFRYRIRHASIAGDRLVCHVDGETFETSGVIDVRVVPGALRVAGGAARLGFISSRSA
jgi:diacylglycerol kinase (ATP)